MVVEGSSSSTHAPTDLHLDNESNIRTRRHGTTVSPFEDDCDVGKNAEKTSLSHVENETSHIPAESALPSCDQTDSMKSSPTRISFSSSCNGDTESLKSESPNVMESSSLLNDSQIPTIKIVPSASHASSDANENTSLRGQKISEEYKSRGPNDDPPISKERKFVPPDGGYGWVVVVAACMANVWIVGFLRSYSILYLRIMHEYGDSAYQASWILALLTTTGFLLGPVTGLLCRKYGARKVAVAGGLFAFTGIFLSSFSTSLIPFIFTLGLLTGLGVGFVSTPGILIVNLYFDKHRGIACAICMSGNAIGAFMMPPLLQYLLLEYGLRGTLLIASALQLHILVSAFLFRPTDVHTRIQELDRKRALRSAKAQLPLTVDDLNKEKKWPKLDILPSGDGQKSSSKVPYTADHKRNEARESLTLELSSYRSLPLTASVPNLKEFRKSLIDMQVWRNEIGDTSSIEEEKKPSMDHIASTEEFVRPTRKRSSSECQYTDRALHLDVNRLRALDVSSETAQAHSVHNKSNVRQAEHSRSRKISLRRFVIGSSVAWKGPAQDFIKEKDPEIANDAVSLKQPNVSMPLLDNSGEEYGKPAMYENGSLRRSSMSLRKKTSSEVQKSTVKEDFKLFAKAIGECFDMSVLKSKSMIIMGLSASLYSMGVPQALFYLHAFYTSVGMEGTEVTSLLSITAVCDLCGRLSIGFIADSNYFKLSHLTVGCTMLASASALSVPSTSTLLGAAGAMGCYSFGVGAFIVLLPTILAKNLGIDRLPATYGFIRLAMGLTTFIAPQVIGAVVDGTGSYLPSYYLMGACMMLGSILLVFMPSPPADLPS